MAKKFLILGVALIMALGLFAGCGDKFATDSVSVSIKVEWKDKFLSEDFSTDDFEWDNIERIEYGTWHSTTTPKTAS